jgi:hypothetical protein
MLHVVSLVAMLACSGMEFLRIVFTLSTVIFHPVSIRHSILCSFKKGMSVKIHFFLFSFPLTSLLVSFKVSFGQYLVYGCQ